jgi:ribosomal protein S27AE
MCGSAARWCARADAIFDVPGMHVLDVNEDDRGRLVLTVESDQVHTGCPSCGVIAASHGRRLGCCMMRRVWVGSRWCGG